MSKIPPPPAHLHPSSPAFAEWMRAVAKGLADYKKQAEDYESYSWAKTTTGANLFCVTGWNVLYQFEVSEEQAKDTWFDLFFYFCFDSGSNTLVNICPPSRVYARITKGASDKVLRETQLQYHGILRVADLVKEGETAGFYKMWLKSGCEGGGGCANDPQTAVLISTMGMIRHR